MQSTAIVATWTKLRPSTVARVLILLRATMCAAYTTAAASVSSSPKPIENPCNDSTPRPKPASSTASQVVAPIRVLRTSAASSGVATT